MIRPFVRMLTNLRISIFAFAGIALGVLAFYEIAVAYPMAGWLYSSVAGAFLIATWPFARGRFLLIRLALLVASVAVIAALYFVPWTTRKPFLRDLNRVRVGMTEAEVRGIMGKYMEGTGWPASPFETLTNDTPLHITGSSSQYSTTTSADGQMVIRDSLVFRHSNVGEFNSDWGVVSMSNGRVVQVEFCPD